MRIPLVCVEFSKSENIQCVCGISDCICLFTMDHIYSSLEAKCVKHAIFDSNCEMCRIWSEVMQYMINSPEIVVVVQLFRSDIHYDYIIEDKYIYNTRNLHDKKRIMQAIPNNIVHHISKLGAHVISNICIVESRRRRNMCYPLNLMSCRRNHIDKRMSIYVKRVIPNSTNKKYVYKVPGCVWTQAHGHIDTEVLLGFSPEYNFDNIGDGCGCFCINEDGVTITLPQQVLIKFQDVHTNILVQSTLILQNSSHLESVQVRIRNFNYNQHTSITSPSTKIDASAMYQHENTLHDDMSFLKTIAIVRTDFGCFSDINKIMCRLDHINDNHADAAVFPRFFCIKDTLDSICIIFGTQKALKIKNIISASIASSETINDHIFTLYLAFKPSSDILYGLAVDFIIRLCDFIYTNVVDSKLFDILKTLYYYDHVLTKKNINIIRPLSPCHDKTRHFQQLLSCDVVFRSTVISEVCSEVIYDTFYGGPFRMYPLDIIGDVLEIDNISYEELKRELKYRQNVVDYNSNIPIDAMRKLLKYTCRKNRFYHDELTWEKISRIRRFFIRDMNHVKHELYIPFNNLVQQSMVHHRLSPVLDSRYHESLSDRLSISTKYRTLFWGAIGDVQLELEKLK
jgi:hypothetical protein